MTKLTRYTRPAELFDWSGMLDNFFTDTPLWQTTTPAVDVQENEKEYLMEVELPGLSEKDIELKVEENLLTISSKKEESKEEKKDGYLLRERKRSEFCRSFVLPQDIDREKIDAKLASGLLKVVLPKTEKAQPKKIEVKTN